MKTNEFYTVGEWEKANKNKRFEFSHFYYYKDTRLIRKVTGFVKVHRKDLDSNLNHFRECKKLIRWNSQGKCYNSNNNHRLRDYDIHLAYDKWSRIDAGIETPLTARMDDNE